MIINDNNNMLKAVNAMKERDVYSLLLFVLFRLKDLPEYSTLSELSYILDSKSLMRFLEYYGGMTITIPTADEFRDVIDALLLYQYANLENGDMAKAHEMLDLPKARIAEIHPVYSAIVGILSNYNFNRGQSEEVEQ